MRDNPLSLAAYLHGATRGNREAWLERAAWAALALGTLDLADTVVVANV
jgi:hypothetical protein